MEHATTPDYAATMTQLGCVIREHGRNGRDNGGKYCTTHSSNLIYDGPQVHAICVTAYNTANGTCGHVVCQRNGDTCLLAS